MKKTGLILTTILLISTFLAGCGSKDSSQTAKTENNKDNTLTIYTTIFPIEDFTSKIGGDLVKVESIYPPGVDAHTFEPSAKTMTKLAEADAFIYSGLGMEGFVDSAKDTLKNEKVILVEAALGIELLENNDDHPHEEENHDDHAHEEEESHDDHAHEEENHDDHAHEEKENHDDHATEEGTTDDHGGHDHGDTDPHVWLDPIYSITLAENIKNALIEIKPDSKDVFEQNFQALKEKLIALDHDFHELVEHATTKEILVSHAAYGYWEKRYGIEQLSVAGLSPTDEPSQKELRTIIETAKEHNIKYVIFEQNATSKISDIVQKEIGAESLTLHNLESATEEDRNNKEDYFSIMKKNLETLKKAMN